MLLNLSSDFLQKWLFAYRMLALALNIILAHPAAMIETLGEAHDLGWKLRIYCREGKGSAMKKHRACTAYADADLLTLVWTRGRAFPVSDLGSRMKCPALWQPAGYDRFPASSRRRVAITASRAPLG